MSKQINVSKDMFKTYPKLQNETDYLKPMKDSYFEKRN